METVALARPVRWTERGEWRRIEATLTLTFLANPTGCSVTASFAVVGQGAAKPLGPLLTRAARPAVRADLRRAARILSARAAGH